MRYFTVLVATYILAAAAVATADQYQVVEVAKAGKLIGTVRLSGDIPPARTLSVTRDKAVCGHEHHAEDLVVNPEVTVQCRRKLR